MKAHPSIKKHKKNFMKHIHLLRNTKESWCNPKLSYRNKDKDSNDSNNNKDNLNNTDNKNGNDNSNSKDNFESNDNNVGNDQDYKQ